MDKLYKGKPYFLMDDLGGKHPYFWVDTHFKVTFPTKKHGRIPLNGLSGFQVRDHFGKYGVDLSLVSTIRGDRGGVVLRLGIVLSTKRIERYDLYKCSFRARDDAHISLPKNVRLRHKHRHQDISRHLYRWFSGLF